MNIDKVSDVGVMLISKPKQSFMDMWIVIFALINIKLVFTDRKIRHKRPMFKKIGGKNSIELANNKNAYHI